MRKYFIVHLSNADVLWTDSMEVAETISASEEYVVIDAETYEQIAIETIGQRFPIAKAKE